MKKLRTSPKTKHRPPLTITIPEISLDTFDHSSPSFDTNARCISPISSTTEVSNATQDLETQLTNMGFNSYSQLIIKHVLNTAKLSKMRESLAERSDFTISNAY